MKRYVLMALLGVAAATTSAASPRFTGDAALRPPEPASADGRFTLNADFKSAPSTSTDGRFGLQAMLRPDASSLGGVCSGVDLIFRNGFDN